MNPNGLALGARRRVCTVVKMASNARSLTTILRRDIWAFEPHERPGSGRIWSNLRPLEVHILITFKQYHSGALATTLSLSICLLLSHCQFAFSNSNRFYADFESPHSPSEGYGKFASLTVHYLRVLSCFLNEGGFMDHWHHANG